MAPRRLFDEWVHLSPLQMWSGPSSFFELLLMPDGNNYHVYDRTSKTFPELKPGMLLFLQLLVDDSIRIPVAFEITRVDQKNLVLELRYLEQNVSRGVQTITFHAHGADSLVTQVSRFSSGNALRDMFYPYYHRMLVEGFQHHLQQLLK